MDRPAAEPDERQPRDERQPGDQPDRADEYAGAEDLDQVAPTEFGEAVDG